MLKFNFQHKASKTPTNQIYKSNKHSLNQIKYQKSPDIITQVNPLYLNNFMQPVNPHQLAFTPTNHTKISENKKMLLPQKSKEFLNKKTLILDLDETLVHSSFVPFENNDIVLNVEFEGMIYNIYVLIRPGAIDFIKKVAKLYEVIIFTASISKYALPLIDILDSDKNIQYKLTREHCTFLNGIYIKELKKLNRDLNDLIILDNSPLAYSFDIDNGLPIKAWYEDKNDNELDKVYFILEFLSKVKDARNFIKRIVDNNEINFEIANEIIKIYNDNMNEYISRKNDFINYNKEDEENNNQKQIIFVNKQNNKNQTKFDDNNKENNNNINIKDRDKLSNNNCKPNKGILINNLIHTPTYRNQITNNNDIVYKSYLNGYYLRNIQNKNSIKTKKNKGKEKNSKTNIQNQKKNTFRIGTKIYEKTNNKTTYKTNNIHIKHNNLYFLNNEKFNNNNNENDIALSTNLSMTSKNGIFSKDKLRYNISLEATNKLLYNKDDLVRRNNNNLITKTNMLSFNNINKKYKYNNLLENLEGKTIKTNYSPNNKNYPRSKSSKLTNNKNKSKKKFINIQNNTKKKLNHVGSYIIHKYHELVLKNPTNDNKKHLNNKVTRSKSTGNFINFNNNNKKPKKPKSTKGRYNFEKNLLINVNKDINKFNKNKVINLFDDLPKTTAYKNRFFI